MMQTAMDKTTIMEHYLGLKAAKLSLMTIKLNPN